jgi:hypothetical protein
VWSLGVYPNAVVREVRSAEEWVELVVQDATRIDGLLYPDWKAIAEQCDGVHMSLRTIAAIQGIPLLASQGVVAPAYWDVESTFWLHWSFSSSQIVTDVTELPQR